MPPGRVLPMLATLGDMPTAAGAYGYELKYDGYRALAAWDGARLRLISRKGNDLLPQFPELAPLGEALAKPATLDGEIVALDHRGLPSFSLLQRRRPRASGDARGPGRIAYMIFDLIAYDGASLIDQPYARRRARLERLRLDGVAWRTPSSTTDGQALLAFARQHGLEGVVAKRLDSGYTPGAVSPQWIKVKLQNREEFVVGGYLLDEAHRLPGLRSLLLGYFDDEGRLHYAGHAGRGIREAERARLQASLDRHRRASSPFVEAVEKARAVWCAPRLVVEAEYNEWTHRGRLRSGTYLGVRGDKAARSVVRPVMEDQLAAR
ncbi:MAG TPA: non-homologous end-joining DNA ligase [Planctomycetota bacterium]|nr:non-homologous end-joining DNA ligase [Planctomycetota bacterium]